MRMVQTDTEFYISAGSIASIYVHNGDIYIVQLSGLKTIYKINCHDTVDRRLAKLLDDIENAKDFERP